MVLGYEVVEALYSGPNVQVERCRRVNDQHSVIIKRLLHPRDRSTDNARLRFEHRILAQLAAAGVVGIVPPLELFDRQGELALVLEDTGSRSVRLCMQQQRFPLQEILHIGQQVARTLAQIHQARVVHKDINPMNVIYNPATRDVHIIDFGIAMELRREMQSVDNLRSVEGTIDYVSPEQTGKTNRLLDFRSDLYSLGVTLYQMLCDRLPFSGADAGATVYAILAKAPVPPRDLNAETPIAFNDLIVRLLEKAPERRYQSAEGVAYDLGQIAAACAAGENNRPFALMQRDVPVRFEIPQKLFGRTQDVAGLRAAYNQVASHGGADIVFVAGASGIGKSALVQELQTDLVGDNAILLAGKFEQLHHHIPFNAFRQAFTGLARRLLQEPEENLNAWRLRLAAVTGNIAQAILDVAPALRPLLPDPKPLSDVGSQQAENRLLMVLTRLLRAIGEKAPLLLFLDDVQWADSGTVKLIKRLMQTEMRESRILVVAAYRDTELTAAHPLHPARRGEIQAVNRITQLTLAPLSQDAIAEMLRDATGNAAAEELAGIVYDKTAGNPFFVHEYMEHLHVQGLLRYDASRRQWTWDQEAIQRGALTDNVAVLLTERIRGLEPVGRQMLSLVSCLGGEFHLEDVVDLSPSSRDEMLVTLSSLASAGFIAPRSPAYRLATATGADVVYRFSHDRIQKAAYDLLDTAQKAEHHRRIGKLLQGRPEHSERLLTIVDHLNAGSSLLEASGERAELANLNVAAAQRAKKSSAHGIAITYLQHALDLQQEAQPTIAWLTNVQRELAESEFLAGQPEAALTRVDRALSAQQDPTEAARLLNLKLLIQDERSCQAEAIETGKQALAKLGVRLTMPAFIVNAIRCKILGKRKSTQELANAPRITDKRMLQVIEIMQDMTPPAARLNAPVLGPMAMLGGFMSLRYGTSRNTARLYATLAAVYGWILNDYPAAARMAAAASACLETVPDSMARSHVVFALAAFADYMHLSPVELVARLEEAHAMAMEEGALSAAAVSMAVAAQALIGVSIDRCVTACEAAERALGVRNNQSYTVAAYRQLALALKGMTPAAETLDSAIDSTKREQSANESHEEWARSCFSAAFAGLGWIHRDFAMGIGHARRALDAKFDKRCPDWAAACLAYFVLLTCCELRRQGKPWPITWAHRGRLFKKLRSLAQASPTRFAGLITIVDAELHDLRGRHDSAATCYEQGCAMLRAVGRPDLLAVALEQTARFYLRRGLPTAAADPLRCAKETYTQWGASVKVGMLAAEFTQLRESAAPAVVRQAHSVTTTTATTQDNVADRLDLQALMQACLAIASERSPERVLTRILESLQEGTGATRAALLWNHGESLQSVLDTAEGSKPAGAVTTYVERSMETLMLEDVAASTMKRHYEGTGVLSVLCVPIVRQQSLKGLVYLESHAATHAFTPERHLWVDVLASQAAVSVENAYLVGNLEKTVEERTRDLKATQERLLKLERTDTEMRMAGGFAHEVLNALTPAGYLLSASFPEGTLDAAGVKELQSDEEALRALLGGVKNALDRGIRVTRRILEYAAVGQSPFGDVTTDLRQVVDSVIAELAPIIQANGIKLSVQVPNAQLAVQQEHALSMVRHLLSNARDGLLAADAARARELTVRAESRGGQVCIEVVDTGVGISPENQERVFAPFYSTKGERGTGLGLALSRKLAECYGGTLAFSSAPSASTTFALTLPKAHQSS